MAASHRVEEWGREGSALRPVHFYELEGRTVWGVTGAIVHDLLERLARATGRPRARGSSGDRPARPGAQRKVGWSANGLPRISSPMVVAGPWPGWTWVSGGSA